MNEQMPSFTAALAAADRQKQLASDTLDRIVDRAARLLTNGETETWAILGTEAAHQLDLGSKHQQFAGDMLAVAAIKLAQARAAGWRTQ